MSDASDEDNKSEPGPVFPALTGESGEPDLSALEQEYAEIEADLAKARQSGELPQVYGDWIEHPSLVLSARHRELARMIAAGLRNKDVCLRLGYTPSRVSVLLKNPRIREEILRFQDRIFDKELTGRLDDIGPDAMDVIESALRDPTLLKPRDRVELAKWGMEKLTGKPAQRHEIESGTLGKFLDKLDSMRDVKAVLDAGPSDEADTTQEAEFTEVDPISDWLKREIKPD